MLDIRSVLVHVVSTHFEGGLGYTSRVTKFFAFPIRARRPDEGVLETAQDCGACGATVPIRVSSGNRLVAAKLAFTAGSILGAVGFVAATMSLDSAPGWVVAFGLFGMPAVAFACAAQAFSFDGVSAGLAGHSASVTSAAVRAAKASRRRTRPPRR